MPTLKRDRDVIRITSKKRKPFNPGYEMTEHGVRFTGKIHTKKYEGPTLKDALEEWEQDLEKEGE